MCWYLFAHTVEGTAHLQLAYNFAIFGSKWSRLPVYDMLHGLKYPTAPTCFWLDTKIKRLRRKLPPLVCPFLVVKTWWIMRRLLWSIINLFGPSLLLQIWKLLDQKRFASDSCSRTTMHRQIPLPDECDSASMAAVGREFQECKDEAQGPWTER
jgi:hypothetical protein